MEAWLTLTGQAVRVDKSCSWSQREGGGAQAVLLCGLPIPVAEYFRQPGVDVAVEGARDTGLELARHLDVGRKVLRRLPHLPAFQRRVRGVSTLVTPLALHRVAIALVMDRDLLGLETMVLRAVWGATRLSRAKEVVFVVLTPGHRISPVMHTRYERVLWMARIACTLGPVQVLMQVIWESDHRPPNVGAICACPACGPPAGLAAARGLVVLGSAGPNRAAAPGAGAHATGSYKQRSGCSCPPRRGAGVPATGGPVATGTVSGGRLPAGGCILVQVVRDVRRWQPGMPIPAQGCWGRARPSSRGARRRAARRVISGRTCAVPCRNC